MISEQESNAISYTRVFAMLAIVACHILAEYHSLWGYIFNIGVQIFLVLSGYLYGEKTIADWKRWTKKRIRKIYIPFLLFLICVAPFYLIFHPEAFSLNGVIPYLFNLQGIAFVLGASLVRGIRHLWFITAIMFAYCSTPILQKLKSYAHIALPILMGLIVVGYLILPKQLMFMASWCYLFAIGYFYAAVEKKKKYDYLILIACVIICFFVNKEIILDYFNPINRIFHDIAGVCIVIWSIKILSRIKSLTIPKWISILDKYSYQVFLVHYTIIVGPFSMAYLTSNIFFNILLIFIVISMGTIVFVLLNNYLDKKIFNKIFSRKSIAHNE